MKIEKKTLSDKICSLSSFVQENWNPGGCILSLQNLPQQWEKYSKNCAMICNMLSAANFKKPLLLKMLIYIWVVGIIICEKFTGKGKRHKGISTVSNCLFLWVEHMRICAIQSTYLYTFLIKITIPWSDNYYYLQLHCFIAILSCFVITILKFHGLFRQCTYGLVVIVICCSVST